MDGETRQQLWKMVSQGTCFPINTLPTYVSSTGTLSSTAVADLTSLFPVLDGFWEMRREHAGKRNSLIRLTLISKSDSELPKPEEEIPTVTESQPAKDAESSVKHSQTEESTRHVNKKQKTKKVKFNENGNTVRRVKSWQDKEKSNWTWLFRFFRIKSLIPVSA